MSAVITELDKTFASAISSDYGTMSIRVVVLKKRQDDAAPEDEPEIPADLEQEEVLATFGKTPVTSYLEDPKRGKECCVFLINGQRQDAWDNAFIVRDLDKKYLRNRTLIIVDLDGLKPEAVANLMSGDRQGFFQGKVYHAISARLAATLKKDPDLERMEEDAEREISELRTGDEAVKQALDQLIEAHHSHADRVQAGKEQAGPGGTRGTGFGRDKPNYVIVEPQDTGTLASGPYLIASPAAAVIRLHPSEPITLIVKTAPPSAWNDLGQLQGQIAPTIDGLGIEPMREGDRATIKMHFDEPDDWEDDQYPVEAVLRVTAMIKGHEEPRLLERRIIISKPKKRKPRQTPLLQDTPTFIRVTSRQPIPLAPGGADTHVRLRWDGKDELALGAPPLWRFTARCSTLSSFPPITFSKPSSGRFELLIQAPATLTAGEELQFEVEALGPGGKKLTAIFVCQVLAPPEPRKVKKVVPEPSAQRKPPYELHYVERSNWDKGYSWSNEEQWTAEDAACFLDPSESKPLVLIINQDMGLLRDYQDSLKTKKLEPSTVKERVTRYTSHVAFHLYQMYLNYRAEQEAQSKDSTVKPQTPEQMRGEINRVAATLIKVMQVSR